MICSLDKCDVNSGLLCFKCDEILSREKSRPERRKRRRQRNNAVFPKTSSRRKTPAVGTMRLLIKVTQKTERHQFLISAIEQTRTERIVTNSTTVSDLLVHCLLSHLRTRATIIVTLMATDQGRATGACQKAKMDLDSPIDTCQINPMALLFQAL